jgi:PEGA domain
MTMTRRIGTLTVGLLLAAAVSASAQPFRHVVVVPRFHAFAPYVYDPFWGPYGYYAYPYYGPRADIRTEIKPKDAEVYIDDYYAGHAEDFDGAFKRLRVAPGGHSITFHLDGFRTVTENVYVKPDSTLKMKATMDRLAAGELSDPAPTPLPPRNRVLTH